MGIKEHLDSANWRGGALKLSLNLFFNSNPGLSLAFPSRSHLTSTAVPQFQPAAAPATPAPDPTHSQANVLHATNSEGSDRDTKERPQRQSTPLRI